MKIRFLLALAAAGCSTAVLLLAPRKVASADLPLASLRLPPGFQVALYARVPNARQLAVGTRGTVFAGSMSDGTVHAIVDADRDGRGERVIVLARGLRMPSGVAFRDGALYVAAVDRVLRFDDIERQLESPPAPVVVDASLPSDESHGWKFIGFGPDGRLYVPVGMPCNVCLKDDPRYGSILRSKPGGGFEVFASGIRNSVGFDWHPLTRELWFTDNGRDLLGDDIPADELNRAPTAGLSFGFPYCHAGVVPDPELGKRRPCADFAAPVQALGAHVAAIGMRFYRGTMFPPQYRNQVFIAEHGSWNRSHKAGYRVSLVRLEGNRAVSYEPFLSGFLQGETAWGRPSDVQELPDGSLLVADDFAGAIYRITYTGH